MSRRRLFTVVVLAVLALVPASAQAAGITGAGGSVLPTRYAAWVASSSAPLPRGPIEVRLQECPSGARWFAGCAFVDRGRVYLGKEARYVDRFFHELGHIFDDRTLTDALRARFAALVGRPGEWGWTATSSNPPIEQFAEAYSMCARHRQIKAVAYGMYNYTPTPAVHRRACAIIRQAAV
jgi:hypothetical protein